MRIIRQSSFVSVPWKNGGGATHEAIRVPPDGEAFQWRVSVAEIDASGPFSDFADYHRFMVLLKGAGVVLKFSSGATATASDGPVPEPRRLQSIGDLAAFDGALATYCELVAGPCVDLNLMVSKKMTGVEARVELLRGRRPLSPGSGGSMVVFPIDAGIELESDGHVEFLAPWDLALLSGADARPVTLSRPGRGERAGVGRIFLATMKGTYMEG
jgi:environmental stress-induced protein Ves